MNYKILLISILALSCFMSCNEPVKLKEQVNDDCVKIGTQIWMIRNLDVDHYRNGDPIPNVTDAKVWAHLKTGAWCYYRNNPANGAKYGKLYNWYAVNDKRGLAPLGWHIPTDEEWTKFGNYVRRLRSKGHKLKSTDTLENGHYIWRNSKMKPTNESGFSALPGGYRNNSGSFCFVGQISSWWSSSESSKSYAWSRDLDSRTELFRYYFKKTSGYSVRIIKD